MSLANVNSNSRLLVDRLVNRAAPDPQMCRAAADPLPGSWLMPAVLSFANLSRTAAQQFCAGGRTAAWRATFKASGTVSAVDLERFGLSGSGPPCRRLADRPQPRCPHCTT